MYMEAVQGRLFVMHGAFLEQRMGARKASACDRYGVLASHSLILLSSAVIGSIEEI